MADFDALKEKVADAWSAQAEWREKAIEDFEFRDGHQWTEEERQELEENRRIPIVFNRTGVNIAAVVGSEINNRTEVRFIPREIGDQKPNEVLSAGGEWFRDQADAEDAESLAFEDCLVCGVGCTDTALDFEDDPEGQPVVRRLDIAEMGWDPTAREKGLADARYVFRVREMPSDDALARFSGYSLGDINADWLERSAEMGTSVNEARDEYKGESEGSSEGVGDTVAVVQVQYRERVEVVEFINPQTGQREEAPGEDWEALGEDVRAAIPHRKFSRWEWFQAFLGREEILDKNQPCWRGSTFKFITGIWDRKDKRFYGLLKAMRDPQRYANKWLSSQIHIIGVNAKGGHFVEADAIDDWDDFEQSYASGDYTVLKSGAIAGGKILPKPQPAIPAALMSLTEFAVDSIRATSGVNMEMLGLRDANQPGVLEYQRKQAAMTTLARYFDALRYYRKAEGEIILHFLREYIAPMGTLVRIVREDQVQYVPLAMDPATRKYDVIVDDAPQAPNEKERAWAIIEKMLPIMQQAGLPLEVWVEVLRHSPVPSALIDKVAEHLQRQEQDGPSPQEQMMQAEMQAKAAEVQAKQLEGQIKQGELQLRQAELQGQQADSQRRAQIDAQKLELDRLKLQIEAAKVPASGAQPPNELELAKIGVERAKVANDARAQMMEAERLQREQQAAETANAGLESALQEGFRALLAELQRSNQTLAAGQQQLAEAMARGQEQVLEAVTAEKEIVRDENGRPVGARIKRG